MSKIIIDILFEGLFLTIENVKTHSMKSIYKFIFGLMILTSNSVIPSVAFGAIKVGLVLDRGGKDDKSFNSAAYEGALKAEKDFKIELKYVEATDLQSLENLHRSFAKKNYDLIIGIGFAQGDALKKVASQFPKINFAIVDADIQLPNVSSLLFEEHEGSFLVGALAALNTKTKVIGFVGGMDIPLIRRFELGYKAGAEKIDPKIKIISNFVGVTPDSWNNPPKAKELALSQISQNSDVIFVAAGASNTGVFDAIEEKKIFAIGVDSNQNAMKPGRILTSMLKRVDTAVYKVIESANNKAFKPGTIRFGLYNNGVDYAIDENNKKLLTPEMIKKISALKSEIISQKIIVPDYYKRK